jgi:hypothetical protein
MPRDRQEQAVGIAGSQQLVDYYLLDELRNGGRPGYAGRVVSQLAEHKVYRTKAVIYSRARAIRSGKTLISPSSDVNGTPAARDGKDKAYAGLWAMVDIAIPDLASRVYIGLAANQLDMVRSHTTFPYLRVCEKDVERSTRLVQIAELIERFKPGPKIDIINDDIFRTMSRVTNCYNIYDLDLMCQLPKESKIDRWVKKIYSSSGIGKVVLSITTSIGRKGNTEERYNQRAGYLRRALEQAGFQEVGYSRYAYRDRIVPMRSERFILNKS